MRKAAANRDDLFKTIRRVLKSRECFYLGTVKKEYWKNIISRELDCTIEDWDEGLVVRGK